MSGDAPAPAPDLSERCSGIYREIARNCGIETARAIHRHYAGAAIKAPRAVDADHHLAIALGLDAAQRFCAHFAGEQLEIPTRWLSGRELRRVVLEKRAAGEKINDIARDLRIPRPSVHRILNQAPAVESDDAPRPTPQLDLFRP